MIELFSAGNRLVLRQSWIDLTGHLLREEVGARQQAGRDELPLPRHDNLTRGSQAANGVSWVLLVAACRNNELHRLRYGCAHPRRGFQPTQRLVMSSNRVMRRLARSVWLGNEDRGAIVRVVIGAGAHLWRLKGVRLAIDDEGAAVLLENRLRRGLSTRWAQLRRCQHRHHRRD